MRKHIAQVTKHPLISGSAVIVIGAMVANVFNYLFNFSLLRILSTSEYATIAGLIAIFNIFVVLSTTIITVFSKFSALYIAQKKENLIGPLLKKGSLYVGVISILFILSLAVLSLPISHFFHIDNALLIILISISLGLTFLSSVAFGIMQGLLRFTIYSVVVIVQTLLKFLLGLGLVLLGFHVFGAVWAIVIAIGIGCVLSFIVLLPFVKKNNSRDITLPNLHKEITVFAMPVLLANIGLTLIFTMDILLADHFFSKIVAGQYAALSLMGRTIFFIVQPVSMVLFPLISQKKEKKEDVFRTLLLCLLIIAIPTVILCVIYFTYPILILKIFAPKPEYRMLLPYLGPFSIFIFFYVFSYFLTTFYLSIGKTKVYVLSILASIFEIVYIIFFHQTIGQVITGLILTSFLLLISLLLYYCKKNTKPTA